MENNIFDIIARKEQDIDCTEKESGEIKRYLSELYFNQPSYIYQAVIKELALLFPLELAEHFEEVQATNKQS